jgi:hypothetical protein
MEKHFHLIPPSQGRIVHQFPGIFYEFELLRIKGLHNQLLLVRKKGVKESASAFDRYVPNY